MERLLKNISTHVALSKEEGEFLLGLLKTRKLKKKQYLIREAEITTEITFVTNGILRLYALDKSGFEHVLQFAPPGWWIGDITSFIKQQPGTLYIDAIEDSTIVSMLKTDLESLYMRVPKMERFFRILAESSLANYQQRLVSSLSQPAIERYNNFCLLYPSLIQCLPQKQVASYIGVTPEFLSKMLSQPSVRKQASR